jgi:membrane fusion protein (multidrug efflux system)
MKDLWRRGAAAISLLAVVTAGLPAFAQQQPGAAASVGVLAMHVQKVPQIYTLPGRAIAFQQVGIRPRVGGVVTKILYEPGKS